MQSQVELYDEKPSEQKIVVNDETNILIIGAGPVGLRFLIELLNKADQSQKKNVVVSMIERNRTYERTQDLTLHFGLLENNLYLKKKLLELVIDRRAYKDSHENIHIPIQELEKCLADYAKLLNVTIQYKRFITRKEFEKLLSKNDVSNRVALEKKLKVEIIVGREELTTFYPNCKIIIGADGAHSSVRQLISEKDEESSIEKTDLRYLIEVKYLARGKVNKLSKLKFYNGQTLLHGFLCSESVKYRQDTEQTQVTLRFLVDEKTYKDPRLNNIMAKNLLPFCADIPLPSHLRKAINIWLNLRGDAVELTSGTINKTILSIYSSKTYSTIQSMLAILLLGDSASGFPFMNGLNLGTEQAIKLAEILLKYLDAILNNDLEGMRKFLTEYSIMTKAIFEKGFKIVAAKDQILSKKERFVASLSKTPEHVTDHPIFLETAHPISLKLAPLNQFVERYTQYANSEAFLLSMNLLTILINHQRLLIQNNGQTDYHLLKAVLSLACRKNHAIMTRTKNWVMLSSNESIQQQKLRYEITPREITEQMGNHIVEIPKELKMADGSPFPVSILHCIVYDLFTDTISLEKKCKCHPTTTMRYNSSSNRHTLMAVKKLVATQVVNQKEIKKSDFNCVVS